MRYVAQRFAQMIIVILVVTFLVSLALRFLPGGTDVAVAAKVGAGATREQIEAVKDELHLNDHFAVGWLRWLGNFVTGNWGTTFGSNQPISELFGKAFPVSMYSMLWAQVIALGVAIPVALLSAYRQNTAIDRFSATSAFGLLSVPNYILGPVLILLFSIQRKWIPYPSTYVNPFESPIGHFKAYILPVVTLALPLYASYMRLLRADLIGTLQSDFITTARAKGVSTFSILTRHALRPSMFSLMTAAAVNIGALIGGGLIVEQLFQLNGIGRVMVESIFKREYPTVQYGVALLAVIYVVANFVVDLAYARIDPRVRDARKLS